MTSEFCTENYGTSQRIAEVQDIVEKGLYRPKRPKLLSPGSLISVLRRPDRFTLPHGYSPDEIRVAAQVGILFTRLGLPLFRAVIADKNMPERELRALVREFKSDIVQAQRESGVPAWWMEMQEGSPAWHSNILFLLGGHKPDRLAARLARSKLYPGDVLNIGETRADAFVAYCAKERASHARFIPGVKMAKRLPGSHKNGAGGGTRLRVSNEVRDALHEGGITPWSRKNASRRLSKAREAVKSQPIEPAPLEWTEFFAAQPLHPAPPRRKRVPVKRAKHLPPSLLMNYPPTADEMMLRLGRTKQEIGERLGLSRQQANNVIVRRFDTSRRIVRRVLEMALDA